MDTHIITPPCPLIITELQLCSWIGQAMPGDRIEYWRGHLVFDRSPESRRLPEEDRLELNRLARRAMWAAESALVHLVQQRHGPDDYSYICVARPRPKFDRRTLMELLAEPAFE